MYRSKRGRYRGFYLRIGRICRMTGIGRSTLILWEGLRHVRFLRTPGGHRHMTHAMYVEFERLTRIPPGSRRKKRIRPPFLCWRAKKPTSRRVSPT